MAILLPNNWTPRQYQMRFVGAFERARVKRFFLTWPRRSGKDLTALAMTTTAMLKRVGNYVHVFPEQSQGRKALWNAIDNEGREIIRNAFPEDLIETRREDEMLIRLKNGSTWQLVGGDRVDSLVGSNIVGGVFSEFALTRARAWDFIRPMLAANGGWAVFVTTPRGLNHAYDLRALAANDPVNWFEETLTSDDTRHIPEDVLAQERASMPPDLFQQEYYCSWTAGQVGVVYGAELDLLTQNGQIDEVPWDPTQPVHTFWDVGVDDDTAILFAQNHRGRPRIIDCLSESNVGINYYVNALNSRPYTYGQHFAPHDAFQREFAANARSTVMVAAELGLNFERMPYLSLLDGITAARTLLPTCYIDRVKGDPLITAMKHYHRKYDETARVWSAKPEHDWSSHLCDALRNMGVSWSLVANNGYARPKVVGTFDEQRRWHHRSRR